jgi:hypothetical protein
VNQVFSQFDTKIAPDGTGGGVPRVRRPHHGSHNLEGVGGPLEHEDSGAGRIEGESQLVRRIGQRKAREFGDRSSAEAREELARVLPPDEYPPFEITPAHPVFRTLFDVKKLPQIPSIQFWRGSGFCLGGGTRAAEGGAGGTVSDAE